MLFNDLRKYLATFFLVTFYASASLAAVDDVSLQFDTIAQITHPTDESYKEIAAGINSDCFIGYFANIKSRITILERKDMPVVLMNESLEQATSITLGKDGDKIIWSLAPSLNRLSLHPKDDIKNLQVVLKYRF